MTVREFFDKFPRVVQFQLEPFRAIMWFEVSPVMPADPALWLTDACEVPQLPPGARVRAAAETLALELLADPAVEKPQVWHRTQFDAPPEPDPAPVPATLSIADLV